MWAGMASVSVFAGELGGVAYTTFHLGPHSAVAGEHWYQVCEQNGHHWLAVATLARQGGPGQLGLAEHYDLVRTALIRRSPAAA